MIRKVTYLFVIKLSISCLDFILLWLTFLHAIPRGEESFQPIFFTPCFTLLSVSPWMRPWVNVCHITCYLVDARISYRNLWRSSAFQEQQLRLLWFTQASRWFPGFLWLDISRRTLVGCRFIWCRGSRRRLKTFMRITLTNKNFKEQSLYIINSLMTREKTHLCPLVN